MSEMSIRDQVSGELLRIQAVFLRPDEPFTWASGIKSPIYCDNRLVLSDPKARSTVEDGLATLIRAAYPGCEVLAGTATAGIAHAALVADRMNLPMAYVRASAKDHGRNNQIEGRVLPGQRVVVVEDLISTGGSVVAVVQALRDAGANVLGIASIFTYGMAKGKSCLQEADVQNASLTDFDSLVKVAAREGYIQEADVERLMRFRDNPGDEGWRS